MNLDDLLEEAASGASMPDSALPVASLWAFRMLQKLGMREHYRLFLMGDQGSMARLLDLHVPGYDDDTPREDVLRFFRERHEGYERERPSIGGELRNNLDRLGQLVGLEAVDLEILGFATILHSHPPLEEISDALGTLNSSDVVRVLSVILDIPRPAIRKALSPDSPMPRSGILQIRRKGAGHLIRKLELMDGLADILVEIQPDIGHMMQEFFRPAKPATLTEEDFRHLGEDWRLLRRYMKAVVTSQRAGVNVLLHGPPGVGKTELARTLCEALGLDLHEISVVDREGDSLRGMHRFGAYRLTQCILSRRKGAVVLFDEIEDVFPESVIPDRHRLSKGWVNELLESNPVPTIWISNAIEQMDAAYLRRFDYVLKIDAPPRSTRRNILAEHLAHLGVSDEWLERMADVPDMVPALVSRAARVVETIRDRRRGGKQVERQLERILGNTLKAMGHELRLAPEGEGRIPYRLDVLNTDQKLPTLLEGLKRVPDARLCLYGPPGTGKTGFARHLAQRLDRPLLVRRASDLLGPYVGMTEAAIAEMFEAARNEGAILLVDEADSFLRDRRGAWHAWEVTMVNEMLTRMESFDGIFIVSTNLVDVLDAASLRRFDFKVRFDWLKPEQAWRLFRQLVTPAALRRDGGERRWRSRLGGLRNLTPGDFANLARQLRVTGEKAGPGMVFELLRREAEHKDGGPGRGVGFMARL